MTTEVSSVLCDTRARYGLLSRLFHWVTAYLLLWQIFVALVWRVLGKGVVVDTLAHVGPSHPLTGMLVVAMVLPRGFWAIISRADRPPNARTQLGRAALIAHGVLYLLMFIVPTLALVRCYGSGKGLFIAGWQVVPATGIARSWLTTPADMLHSPLAWLLALLIAGHVLMVCAHEFVLRDRTLDRMIGRLRTIV